MSEITGELGFECLTDRDSLGIARVEGHILIGGKTVKRFPRWKEAVECIARIPAPGRASG